MDLTDEEDDLVFFLFCFGTLSTSGNDWSENFPGDNWNPLGWSNSATADLFKLKSANKFLILQILGWKKENTGMAENLAEF